MLLLILAHGDEVRLVEQDIGRHQRGIGKEAAVDVLGVFRAFVLELGHAAQLTEHRIAVEDPAELGVLVHVGLQEKGVLLRVETAGDILRQLLERTAPQRGGVVARGESVQVGHEVIAVKLLGALSPVFDRPEIGAQRQIAGGLDAREHDLFLFHRDCIHLATSFIHTRPDGLQ